MTLDPIALKFLKDAAALGAPPIGELEPAQVRAGIKASGTGPGPEIHSIEDMEMAGPEGPIPVRIYPSIRTDKSSSSCIFPRRRLGYWRYRVE